MPFTAIDGGRIHHQLEGRSGGPVLLLSHSLGTDLGMWAPQVTALAAERALLRYDARGHGASAVTPGPYTIERLARDAVALLDALGIARVAFCGLSMGGMVGIWLGLHAPERIERLVLCNTGARIGTRALWDARIDAVRGGGMGAIADAVLGRWFTAPFLAARSGEVARLRQTLLGTPAEGYASCCAAIRDMDEREAVSRIRVPTLVIAGSRDEATPPASGRFLAERIPGARYLELEAAHLSNVEAPEPFAEAVRGFLAG